MPASFVSSGQLHLIADGHGDNRANRAEIDVTGLAANTSVTLSFEARWVHGSPRLIAQTLDHSVGQAFRLEIPETSALRGPSTRPINPPLHRKLMRSAIVHPFPSPPKTCASRRGSAPRCRSRPWNSGIDRTMPMGTRLFSGKSMYDDGVNGGDAIAGDGIYTATLTEHKVNGRVVQFFVRATAQNAQSRAQPWQATLRPALYVVDDRSIPRDLRTARFVVSAFDLDAISNGETAKHQYRYPRLSNNDYKNMTFISNEEEVRYAGLIRNSGSPWTRGGKIQPR